MRQWIVSGFLVLAGTIGLVLANDLPKSPGSTVDRNPRQAASRIIRVAETENTQSGTAKPSAAEAVIKQATGVLLKAYTAGDAKAFAAAFTARGEYIDAKGTIFHGHKAIEDEFATFFRETPDTTIEVDFNSTRSIAAGVIAADCTTRFRQSSMTPVVVGRCQLVCSHESDKWLIASLRETDATSDMSSHHAQVSQLDWMVGDWIGEGAQSHLHFSCHWDESGNFLLREFSLHTAGTKPLTGTQRIGYDPISHRLKIWVFDSAGGYSEGYFTHDGDTWILRTSGVTPDGRITSTTNAFAKLDSHRISSEIIDHVVGGDPVHDTEQKLTLVRKPSSSVERSAQSDRRQLNTK